MTTTAPTEGSIEAITAELQGRRHAVELQSMRGLAALIVALFHCSIYFAHDPRTSAAMSLALNAPASVISFFVLSGFVLTLSQLGRPIDATETIAFYVRRLFRIYPALWLACLIAIAYHLFSRHAAFDPLVTPWWTAQVHPQGLDLKVLAQSFAGKATELPLPIWTLFVELVGSFVMPLIVWAFRRSPRHLLAVSAAFLAIGLVPALNLYNLPMFMTSFCLGAGALLAVRPLTLRLTSDGTARLVAVAALFVLWFGRSFFGLLPEDPYGRVGLLASSAGAAALIATIYARPGAFAFLRWSSLTWLGDISYSFYILHMPILGFLAYGVATLFGSALAANLLAATLVLMAVTVAVTCVVSALSYRFVEVAGIRAGKFAVGVLRRDRPPAPAKGDDIVRPSV